MTASVHVTDSLQKALDGLLGFLPHLLGFLAILVVGWIVARIVKGVVAKVLQKAKLDEALHSGQTGRYVEKLSPGASPSRLIGGVVFWLILLFVLSAAIGALQIAAVTTFMNQVLAYLPNVVAGVLIFVVAGAIAAAVGGLATKAMGDTPTGKVVATAVPGLIMAIAIFMILNQLRIAPQIVTITYGALIGAIALGSALAFGLGGRDVASRMLDEAYGRGRDNKDRVKDDIEKGADRTREEVQQRAGNSAGAYAGPARPQGA
jgi:ABC-type multidrug transport system fused ATPase/permease subunit